VDMEDVAVLALKMSSINKIKEKFVYERILDKFVNSIQIIIKK
jgi:hypothetical protein